MSKEALAKVVQRAISDASFRRQLSSDTAGALRGFDLTPDEVSALRAGDAGRLSTLGVDQRMSKSFALGGALAATKMAQSDLAASNPSMIDDVSGVGSRTVIPADPHANLTADDPGSASNRSAVADGTWAGSTHEMNEGSGGASAQSVRAGDDWKFTDRAATQGSVAPIEGSPEATAVELGRSGSGGSANYPAHDGLAGPSAAGSARAGDDWARAANAQADDSARIGTARLDDASASSRGASVPNDDPDGFLAANANADLSGSVVRSNVNDDPDGFLAANANADLKGGSAPETAFINDSEGYLTSVGYDANSAASAVTDSHDRATENAGSASNADDDSGASNDTTEGGPNVDH